MSFDILPRESWEAKQEAHEERIDAATAGHRRRSGRGEAHPIEDFLFQYYRYSPAQLRRWHPGPGLALADAAPLPRAGWRFYRARGDAVVLDLAAFVQRRSSTIDFVRSLLRATLAAAPVHGCFGLHEWAMVYRADEESLRHRGLPLRLGAAGTDAVLEANPIRCTHYDAFRFFTPAAADRATLVPSRERQRELEQPGCLHAGMDLYKWCYKLAPLVPSDLVADAFDLARDIRVLDMRASPYDVAPLGHDPVAIETAAGKAEYAAAQRVFTGRANALRTSLLTLLDGVSDTIAPAAGEPLTEPRS